jgi:GT2 family glycosyltransferase
VETLPGCSVVIIAYNSGQWLRLCLQSLRPAMAGLDGQVIVVDNASVDPELLVLPQEFPEVEWIRSEENLGFGRGCNLGVSRARHPWIFCVNPDTLLMPDTLKDTLRFALAKPGIGMVGCRILNPDGTLQKACRRSFPSPWNAITRALGLSALFPKSRLFGHYNLTYLDEWKATEVEALSGSFFCIASDLYRELGGFDEDFFLYGEDLDLCYRVLKAGRQNWYTPDATLVHFKGRSAQTLRWRSLWSFYSAMWIFARKHPELHGTPLPLMRLGIAVSFFLGLVERTVQGTLWAVDGAALTVLAAIGATLGGDWRATGLFAAGAWLVHLVVGAYQARSLQRLAGGGALALLLGLAAFQTVGLGWHGLLLPTCWMALRGLWGWVGANKRFFLSRRRRVLVLAHEEAPLRRVLGMEALLEDPERDVLGGVLLDQSTAPAGLMGCQLPLAELVEQAGAKELCLVPDRQGRWVETWLGGSVPGNLPLRLWVADSSIGSSRWPEVSLLR